MTSIPPHKQHGLQDIDDGDTLSSTHHVRRRDKALDFLGFSGSKTRASRTRYPANLYTRYMNFSQHYSPTPKVPERLGNAGNARLERWQSQVAI
ncbi:hypothetical protein BGZ68_010861, partial [Mortierella alpina]